MRCPLTPKWLYDNHNNQRDMKKLLIRLRQKSCLAKKLKSSIEVTIAKASFPEDWVIDYNAGQKVGPLVVAGQVPKRQECCVFILIMFPM